jgi:hypothetical protein
MEADYEFLLNGPCVFAQYIDKSSSMVLSCRIN